MTALHLTAQAALLVLPGAVVARALRMPALVSLGVGALLTYGLVATASTLFPAVGLSWQLHTFAALTVGVAVVAGVAAWLAGRWAPPRADEPQPREGGWSTPEVAAVAVACAVAGAIGVAVYWRATGGFTYFQQNYDATFHANAIRIVADTADPSASVLGKVADTSAGEFFYPHAYHALSALLVQQGVPVPAVIGLQAAVLPALLAAGLATAGYLLGSRSQLCALAALLSCAVVVLPYDMWVWGPLLPFGTAAALVPAGAALGVRAVRDRRGGLGWAALGVGMAGMLALHPSVAVALAMALTALLVQRWASAGRLPIRDVGRLAAAAVLTVLAALGQVLGSVRAASQTIAGTGLDVDWPATVTPGQAVGEILTFNVHVARPQVWLAIGLLIGLYSLPRLREWWWLLATGAVFATLYVVAAAYEGPWVGTLTDFWWNDRYRFAALAAPAMIVLAAGGLLRVVDALAGGLGRLRLPQHLRALAATVLVVSCFVVVTDGLYAPVTTSRLTAQFGPGPSAGTGERAALEYLARVVPDDATVLNDPFDGSAWMWAAHGVRPVFGQALFFPGDREAIGPDRRLLYERFNRIDDDVAVQRAVERLGVEYVFVGSTMLHEGIQRASGLRGLDRVESLEPLYADGGARVYRVLDPEERAPRP